MLLIEKYTRQHIKQLVMDGICSWAVLLRYDIYLVYDAYIKSGHPVSCAVTWTADKFKKSERYVYLIISEMQKEL